MRAWLIPLVVLALSLPLACTLAPRAKGVPIAFPSAHGRLAHGQLYLPRGPARAAVVCVFSMYQVDNAAAPTCATLADNGVAVLSLGFEKGLQFGDYVADVSAAVDAVKRRIGVEDNHIILLGHSMGADLIANSAATNEHVHKLFSIGFSSIAPPDWPCPRNEQRFAVGLFDELHSWAEMRESEIIEWNRQMQPVPDLHRSRPPTSEEKKGVIADGERLYVLPWSNHVLEIYDPALIRSVLTWAEVPAQTPPTRLPTWLIAVALSATAGVVLGIRILHRMPPHLAGRVALAAAITIPAMVGAPTVSICALLAWTIANALTRTTPEDPIARRRLWLRRAGALYAAFAASAVITAMPTLTAEPEWTPYVPLFLAYGPLAMVSVTLLKAAGWFAGLWVAIPALVETAAPGWPFTAVSIPFSHAFQALEKLNLYPQIHATWGQAALAAILLAAAAIAWHQTLHAGYTLDVAQTTRLIRVLAMRILVPIGVFVIVVHLHCGRRGEQE